MSRLKEFYTNKVIDILKKELSISNIMQIPRLIKITLNMGVGEAVKDKKHMKSALNDLQLISGQKPISTKSKKSIAGFKIRDGWPIGAKVTLRSNHMYEFFDRLITIAIPRIRDFRGLPATSFDGTGNYSMGIREHIAFPEIDYDKVDVIRGLNITITTSTSSDKYARALLTAFNFPLQSEKGVI